jgi:hypothetical protein
MPGGAGTPPQDFLSQVSSQLSGQQRMGGAEGGGLNVDLPSLAMSQARMLAAMPKAQQELALQNLELQSPEFADLVRQMLASLSSQGGGGEKKTTTNAVDTRPLPEQRPARRANPGV